MFYVFLKYFGGFLCFRLTPDVGWIQTWASAKALQHMGHLLNPMNWAGFSFYVFIMILNYYFLILETLDTEK